MNPKLDLFDAIQARITEEIPEIKTFRLYNNQFAKEGAEKAFGYPALMVEFVEEPYITKNESLQEADLTLVFHLGFASLKTEDRAIFELSQKVNQSLQGFSVSDSFSPLNRRRELQDTDHDGVIVWKIEYNTLLTDNTAHRKRRLVLMTTEVDLEIEKDPSAPWLQQLDQ
jgi:hypothetical protein